MCIQGTLGASWKRTLDSTPALHRAPCTHKFTEKLNAIAFKKHYIIVAAVWGKPTLGYYG